NRVVTIWWTNPDMSTPIRSNLTSSLESQKSIQMLFPQQIPVYLEQIIVQRDREEGSRQPDQSIALSHRSGSVPYAESQRHNPGPHNYSIPCDEDTISRMPDPFSELDALHRSRPRRMFGRNLSTSLERSAAPTVHPSRSILDNTWRTTTSNPRRRSAAAEAVRNRIEAWLDNFHSHIGTPSTTYVNQDRAISPSANSSSQRPTVTSSPHTRSTRLKADAVRALLSVSSASVSRRNNTNHRTSDSPSALSKLSMTELLGLRSSLEAQHQEIQTSLSAIEAAIHFQRATESDGRLSGFSDTETQPHSTSHLEAGESSSALATQPPFMSSTQSEYQLDASGRIGAKFGSVEYIFDRQSSSDSDSRSPVEEYVADNGSYHMQSLTGSENNAHRQSTPTDPTECQDYIDSQSSRSSGGDEDFGYQSDASQQGDEHYETANSDSDHGEQAYEYSDGGNTYVDYSDDDY
ncbi:hypothetical protein EXIGLDRAFT_694087, partial [Exidia glandulosa HHB12029]